MIDLSAETRRINRQVSRMTWRDSYAAEVPYRIHNSGTGEGHGLGGPDLAPEFVAYLRDAGVCFCEPREIDIDGEAHMRFRHVCDRRLRGPDTVTGEKFHTRRIKRALRQLRSICFEEWEVVHARLARGLPWEQVIEQVNGHRRARGAPEATPLEIGILAVSGFDKIGAAY